MQTRLGKLPFAPPIGWVVFLSFAAVIAAFGLVFFRIWVSEDAAASREGAFISLMFEQHKEEILANIAPYAASDAAFLNVTLSPSSAWIEKRFSNDMAAAVSYDAAWLVAPDDTIVFQSVAETSDGASVVDLAAFPSIKDAVHNIRSTTLALSTELSATGDNYIGRRHQISDIHLVRWQGQIALVASSAIVPDPAPATELREPPYVLVTLSVMDESQVAEISPRVTLIDLEDTPSVAPDRNGLAMIAPGGVTLGYLTWRPMSQATRIVRNAAPLLLLLVGLAAWVTWRVVRSNSRAQEQLADIALQSQYDANHDSLTGFSLRDHFYDRAAEALGNANGNQTALIYIDIDNLRHVNDTWGHAAGDELVRAIARRIKERFGSHQIAGRVGGDEFLILVSSFANKAEIEAHLRDVMNALIQPIRFERNLIDNSCSAGIAYFPEHGDSIEELFKAADVALNRAKEHSQHGYAVFDPTMDASLKENRSLREDLKEAVQNGELELFYQPIICTEDSIPTHAEALLRWNHPTRGRIPPDSFLSIAEDCGLMPDIGRWVAEQAIKDAATWPMDFGVSINVNTSQLLHRDFPQEVGEFLNTYELDPDRLTIEITETQILDRIEDTQSVQKKLTDIGVRFALDDFGTGYSSLSYLHLYDFQTLKIDKSFLVDHTLSEDTKGLLSTMIHLGQVLGMTVVVEGVETEDQRAFLAKSGCAELQGYLFAKPMPLSDLVSTYGKK